ncbi:AraC family transcriptional regulator [Paenibacillus sp. EC2-1]|uniref:helix-turn-helix transcriptional regulator n=1 Tax=Paenibacillus sp. EC2-1 TaxID=3388665 RepID=UPI003BEF2C95
MLNTGSFAFRYSDDLPIFRLDSLGWTNDASTGYFNDGQHRRDHGHVIFQYTLSGMGRIDLDGQTYDLPPGYGFFVRVPSRHRYYYPVDGKEPWAFIWLNARGEDVIRMWERIIERHGSLLQINESSQPIILFWNLYRAVSVDRISDPSELSALLYRWMISFLGPNLNDISEDTAKSHQAILQAKHVISEKYAQPLTLDEIAAECGVSSSYLCRLFQKEQYDSPLTYLQRRRIEAAVTMLRRTDESIQDIAAKCGFSSSSYFGKVFRQYMELSPGEFRRRQDLYPFDTVYLN